MWPSLEQMLLLKACLLQDGSAKEAWEKWSRRVDFENMDSASYNLSPLLVRNPTLLALEDPIFLKCQGIYRQIWTANQILWKKVTPTLIRAIDAGVEKIVMLKGMAMILHYYQDFGVRTIGDIDFLIKVDDIPLIEPVLKQEGWKQGVARIDLSSMEHLKRWHALNLKRKDGANLDLHWSFIQEHSSKLDAAVLSSAIQNGSFYVPNPTDLFLQTCVHGLKYSPVPLIRWIADAMTILKQKEMDWDRLVDHAFESRLSLPLASAIEFLIQHFCAPIPQKTLQQLKTITPTRLEHLEYKSNTSGRGGMAGWYRYCLNRGFLTRSSEILHVHKYLYLQTVARLSSDWLIPFFVIYWTLKRLVVACLKRFAYSTNI